LFFDFFFNPPPKPTKHLELHYSTHDPKVRFYNGDFTNGLEFGVSSIRHSNDSVEISYHYVDDHLEKHAFYVFVMEQIQRQVDGYKNNVHCRFTMDVPNGHYSRCYIESVNHEVYDIRGPVDMVVNIKWNEFEYKYPDKQEDAMTTPNA
jgi:hypothetical protein